jgi:hypothetical protein
MDIIAYQIGAVFLLAALFIAGTMTRGLLPRASVKTLQTTLVLAALLAAGYAVHREMPSLAGFFDRPRGETNPVPGQAELKQAGSVAAAKKTGEPRRPTLVREAEVIHEADPAPEAQGPLIQIDERPEPATKPAKGVKKAAQSVGRFLHIGHGEPKPEEDTNR